MHLIGIQYSSVGKDGRRKIDVERQFIEGVCCLALITRVMNDKRNPDRFLMGKPFSGKPSFPKVEPVVRGEDDHCIFGHAMLPEGLSHAAYFAVHPEEKSVVVFYRLLIERWGKTNFPAPSGF